MDFLHFISRRRTPHGPSPGGAVSNGGTERSFPCGDPGFRPADKGILKGCEVFAGRFGEADPGILELLAESAARPEQDMPLTADLTLKRLSIQVAPMISAYELQKFIEMFLEDTFRVKGFIRTTDGLFLADCVGNVASLKPCALEIPEEKCGWLTVLSGAGMPVRKAVREAVRWYSKHILSVE